MSTIKVEIPANRPDLARKAAELFSLAAGPAQTAGDELIDELDQNVPAAQTAPVSTLAPAPAAQTSVDMKGVQFDPEMCAKAKDPFYGSGARQGQWKKRHGVDMDDYDAWYSGELAANKEMAAGAENVASPAPAPVNTQNAFAAPAQTVAAPAATAAPAPVAEPPPADCGSFMAWVSKKQAAGLLSQEDISNAYQKAGVQDVMQLFPPTPPETVKQNVQNLYQLLAENAGA